MDNKTTKQISKKTSGVLTRDVLVELSRTDKENRTIEIAFSSETPVQRWGEYEVLNHDADSVRLERAQTNGPLLVDHRWDDQIGTIEKIWIDADRVGRAVVRFGKSERASEIFNDVVDNIRKSISVGYRIWKVIRESGGGDEPETHRVMDWEPLEISFVSVPADITVGVGRELTRESDEKNEYELITTTEVRTMDPNENKENSENVGNEGGANRAAPGNKIDYQAAARKAVKEARDADAKRRTAIRTIAATYNEEGAHDNLVVDALRSDTSADEFAQKIAEAELKRRENDTPDTHLDLSEKDTAEYSLCRALAAQHTGNWKDAGLEREMSDTIADKLDIEARGVLVPFDVQTRVVTTTGPGAGALGVDHMPGSFIDNLRDMSVLMKLGARRLAGLQGNISIPRKTGNATFNWVDEDVDSTDSDVTIGTLPLSPKTVTGSVPISRRALLQLTPDMDSLIMADMSEGAALAIDIAGINGAVGGDNPVGIMNTTGVLTNAIATPGEPTWEEVVNFETLAAAANAMAGGSSYITSAAVRGYMKTAKKDPGSGIFLIENNEANGYKVNVKTDAGFPVDSILYGDFSQVIVAMWGVLDVVVDDATKVKSGGLVIRMFQDLDIGVRQPTAFVKNA